MIGSETERNSELRAFSVADANLGFPSQSLFETRHCGNHVYQDYPPPTNSFTFNSLEMKGCKGEDYSFPVRLHYLLDVLQQDGLSHLACWQPHGRCFVVHNPEEFCQKVLPLWFRQSRFGSFQRQLNLYGFKRMKTGRDKGGYYHSSFIRGQPQMAQSIKRCKATKNKRLQDDEPEEPNFYSIPFVPLTYPAQVVQVQQYAGPNSHYAPPPPHQQVPMLQLSQAQHPHPPRVPTPPTNLPLNPPTAPPPGTAVAYYDASVPTLLTVPHFDAEDMPVIPNENIPVPSFAKHGPGEITVPLLQSKLLASPSRQALTQSLSYAYTPHKEVAPAPASNPM